MSSERTIRLSKDVRRAADELNLLAARGHGDTAYAVMLRMKLSAMVAELLTADLIERLQTGDRQPF